MLLAGRAFADSTEAYLIVETDMDEFWLALGNKHIGAEPLGYLHYVRCAGADDAVNCLARTFELRQVVPAGSPTPCPVISSSGVLWTRRATREVDQANPFYLPAEDLMLQSERPVADESSRHEA